MTTSGPQIQPDRPADATRTDRSDAAYPDAPYPDDPRGAAATREARPEEPYPVGQDDPSVAQSYDPSTRQRDPQAPGVYETRDRSGGQRDPGAYDTDPAEGRGGDHSLRSDIPNGGVRPSASGAETSTDTALFDDRDLPGLRSRWDDVQAAFVDDPRECVQKADALVSAVVDQLTDNFTHARSRLEEQWARGEEASTEDLRIALKRYRAFFERLLSV